MYRLLSYSEHNYKKIIRCFAVPQKSVLYLVLGHVVWSLIILLRFDKFNHDLGIHIVIHKQDFMRFAKDSSLSEFGNKY